MYDLVYNFECLKEIKQAFPSAKIEGASDDEHYGRFSVELPDDKRREYLKFIIVMGIAPASLIFSTYGQKKEHKKEMKDIIDEISREFGGDNPENNTKSLGAER